MSKENTRNTKIEDVYDASSFREIGHQLIDLLADHVESAQSKEKPVLKYRTPEEELSFWQQDFDNETDFSIQFFEDILEHSIAVHHPNYMGHQVAAPALISSLGGLVSDVLSNGTGVYEMGMSSNALEKIISDFVAKYIGYGPDASGFMTSGGTLANLTALLAARRAKAPDAVWEDGHQKKLAVLVSEEAHYCIDRAARILGFGSEGIIKIPVNESFQIRTDVLEEYLQKAIENDLHVIAIVGCASSTATGSYDDLTALADFAELHNIWLHIDGAHGGGVVFSDKYNHLVKGIDRADSVVIDFHKMLLTPALTTSLIFKRSIDAFANFQQKADYLWDSQQPKEWYDSGKRTFECTKLMMSIKVYAILKKHGTDIFRKNIDHLYDLGNSFGQLIELHSDFELAVLPQTNIVNFRYIKVEVDQRDSANEKIRRALLQDGQFYIVQTIIRKERYLRVAIMNPMTTMGAFKELLAKIVGIAIKLNS